MNQHSSKQAMIHIPLAERLRPKEVEDIIGQEKVISCVQSAEALSSSKALPDDSTVPSAGAMPSGETAPVTRAHSTQSKKYTGALGEYLLQGKIPSLILWGPPGTGKTSIARILMKEIPNAHIEEISAVSSGTAEIKKICGAAEQRLEEGGLTCFFIDEIHRFNKAQQDSLLHYVEEGKIILIGATTENPSFEINNALLSRVQVFILELLSEIHLQTIFKKAEQELNHTFDIDNDAREHIIRTAGGDARRLLNIVEQVYIYQKNNNKTIDVNILQDIIKIHISAQYDKAGDMHYNLISALHKSIRGSDCDAALYWFARMLEGGEDPRYIARRLLRCAYEDIGLADKDAADYVLTAWQSYERLGSPEGELAIASAVVYLALSPKSNGTYKAYNQARVAAKQTPNISPPNHILNAPTKLMKDIGYGKDYQYDHDTTSGFSGQNYFPDKMPRQKYYEPQERGFEREMKKRLEYFERKRKEIQDAGK